MVDMIDTLENRYGIRFTMINLKKNASNSERVKRVRTACTERHQREMKTKTIVTIDNCELVHCLI